MVNPELWILETALQSLIPFRMLTYRDLEALHNKPGHGLVPDSLADLLERLLWQGDIFVEGLEREQRLFSGAELREMLRVGTRDRDAAYGLTEKGGARWEIDAHADWNRYVEDATHLDEPAFREIICADRDRFEVYVTRGLAEMGDATGPGSETRDRLAPWRATYWKTLPVGYRLRCRPSEQRFQHEDREAWRRWQEWRTWHRGSDGRLMP